MQIVKMIIGAVGLLLVLRVLYEIKFELLLCVK